MGKIPEELAYDKFCAEPLVKFAGGADRASFCAGYATAWNEAIETAAKASKQSWFQDGDQIASTIRTLKR